MILLPLLTGLALAAFSIAQADPTESAEGFFLAVTVTALLAATGAGEAARGEATARRRNAGRWSLGIALAALLAFYFLHQGPQRGGVLLAVLVVGLLGGLALPWRGLETPAAEGRVMLTWEAALPWSLAAAFGVQAVASPDAVLRLGAGLRRLAGEGEAVASADLVAAGVRLLGLPLVAGLALALLGVVLGRLGLLLGAGHLLLLPGVDPALAGLLAIAASLTAGVALYLRRRHGTAGGLRLGPGIRRVLDAYGVLLLVLALPILLLAAYPWQRDAPWSALPALLDPPTTEVVALDRGPVALTSDHPSFRAELGRVVPSRALAVDTVLVHGAGVTGSTVAYVSLYDAEGELVGRVELVAGENTADWAAGREDVASREGFVAPAAWHHSVAPSGRFFARRYREVAERPPGYLARKGPDPVAAVEVVRAPRLPAETQVHLHRLELR